MSDLTNRTTRRPLASRLIVAAAAAVLVTGAATPAARAAAGADNPPGTPAESAGPVDQTTGTCHLYANRLNFGVDCSVLSGRNRSIRAILDGDPLPECWDEELPPHLAREYAAAAAAQPEPGAYWLHTCLSGIDPETLLVTGTVTFTRSVVWIPAGEDPTRLTPNQRLLIEIRSDQGMLDAPVVLTSPVVRPRVGQDVAFYIRPGSAEPGTPAVVGPIEVSGRGVGTVRMRARVTHLDVYPVRGTRIGCPGAGIEVRPGDTRATHPQACWWRYPHSSAGQPGHLYPVQAVAYWQIEYDTGAGWQLFATYGRSGRTGLPVTEIQTLVVP